MTDPVLPEPLVPAEVDLRGYEFMNLYGDRLFKSETWIAAKPEQKVAMLQLWWHAFAKEIPAASLPDNDQLLTNYAGFGISVSSWKKARTQVLRGFIACSDGRLYHPFIAKVAISAWKSRLADGLRGVKARIGATQKRLGDAKSETDKSHIRNLLQNQEQELSQLMDWSVTADKYAMSQGPKGKERKGDERKGEGLSSKTVAASNNASTVDPPPDARAGSEPAEPEKATLRGAMSKALRDEGVTGATPSHPQIVAWIEAGITIQTLREAIDNARDKKPKPQPIPIAYLVPIVTHLTTPVASGLNGHRKPWYAATWQDIVTKGAEKGLKESDYDNAPAFKSAVMKAHGITAEQAQKAEKEWA